MLTEGVISAAGDALVELAVSSRFNFVLGLENDLNMSDCSLLAADGLIAGFFSTSWGPGATAAWDVDLSLDEGRSDGLTAFLCSLLMSWLLPIAFSLIVSAGTDGAPTGGRLPVLR